ncbi:DUF5324 family protein [Streptomyces spongiicola]|uniref:Transcriptional regulator n=1 Tax=Streptomyces spongiicola TaxID=1690221 RepID=A0ABN5KS13_9ACTN|nr:DUF5324 family protein [Streptomyces spongiicola]AWK12942.1 transcriptional regulator [Streptomyces spongiicola]
MTRMDSVRAATDTAKESVLHAADVVAPYAGTAKDQAAIYAHQARVALEPKVKKAARQARQQARVQYESHVAPHVPPQVDEAAHRAAVMTRSAARQAADYTAPRLEHAVAVAQPVGQEAVTRSAAALAALRGSVTAEDIRKLAKKKERRAKCGRAAKGAVVVGAVAVGLFAVWKWWDRQANPDWLVEPPAATEVPDRPLSSVGGSDGSEPDPDVQAKQAESESGSGSESDREDRR